MSKRGPIKPRDPGPHKFQPCQYALDPFHSCPHTSRGDGKIYCHLDLGDTYKCWMPMTAEVHQTK